jgi:hypothetical protein
MRIVLLIEPNGDDEQLAVNFDALAALSQAQRLGVAKALTATAYAICDKHSDRDDLISPGAFELAGHLNGAVQALLQTAAELRRADYFAAIRDQHEACGAHVVH